MNFYQFSSEYFWQIIPLQYFNETFTKWPLKVSIFFNFTRLSKLKFSSPISRFQYQLQLIYNMAHLTLSLCTILLICYKLSDDSASKLRSRRQKQDRIGNQVLYRGILIGLTLHGWHAFTTAGGASEVEIFVFKCLPWPGFETRTSQSNGRERYHSTTARGVHPPLRPWCIFPLSFRFPPYLLKILRLCGKFKKFDLFPKKFPIFIRQNFWRPFTFLVVDHKFRISPQFWLFQCISPLIRENVLFPPTFQNSPLFLKNSPAFYILYVYFPPYFDHDAFMHHPMHVLDAPVLYYTQKHSRHSMDTALEFHAEAPQATVSEGLAQGLYVASRVGVEPMRLRRKGVDSVKAPLRPKISWGYNLA